MAELKLSAAWAARLKLRDVGAKLRADGADLWGDGAKLRAEGLAEGYRLWAEGDSRWAEGDRLWAEAIISAYGNIKIKWSWQTAHGECKLENGDVYGAKQPADAT